MCVWRVIRFTIYLLMIMVSLASAREFVDKRTPEDRQSWFMGSRYGRSSNPGGGGGGTRHLIVTPRRDDRFHPGSRYGKRTVTMTTSGTGPVGMRTLASAPVPTNLGNGNDLEMDSSNELAAGTGPGEDIGEHQNVQCSYTGVADLYRCHVHVRKENTSGEFLVN